MENALIGCLFVLIVLLVGFYNRLVRKRNMVDEAWSGIDVQLRRRHELIPRLVECVKAYASHERATLESVLALRAQAAQATNANAAESVEQRISQDLRPLLALAEAYPELKAVNTFHQLQQELVDVEEDLQMARRYYNGSVRNHNTLIEAFPGLLFAPLFKANPRPFFTVDSASERLSPTINVHPGEPAQ